jgi:hypothetical protein
MSTASKPNRTTHTPGPWTVEPCTHGGLLLRRGDQIGPGTHVQSSLQILPVEDAHLIAAAPELLSSLRDAYEELQLHGVGPQCDGMKAIAAAIAKAEGRE